MGKAAHYYNGASWQQFGVTEADITLATGVIANHFVSIKDSGDNLYVWCGKIGATGGTRANIIKITSAGVKTVGYIPNGSGSLNIAGLPTMMLDRSEDMMWIAFTTSYGSTQYILYSFPTTFNDAQDVTLTQFKNNLGYADVRFSIYQDRYIWVASGSTVKIYDYETKAELASVSVTAVPIYNICCDVNNTLFLTSKSGYYQDIHSIKFNGSNTLTDSILAHIYSISDTFISNNKQIMIDSFGDLIILTNSGTVSRLLKYNISGTLIHNLNLVNSYYNLYTDSQGNYYYSNALATYKIAANTAQGQNFTGTGTKILDSGMTTYGNDITGYNPAVFG
jgi:hypothetical protein